MKGLEPVGMNVVVNAVLGVVVTVEQRLRGDFGEYTIQRHAHESNMTRWDEHSSRLGTRRGGHCRKGITR